MFDPLYCAQLHDRLVVLAEYVDGARPSRDAIRLCSQELRARLSPNLQRFLTKIDARPSNTVFTTIMPFCRLPNFRHFFKYRDWPQFASRGDDLVLLFSDERNPEKGGLFFDQQRELACWINPSIGFPPDGSWLPLANILSRWIQMWETFKITIDHSLRPWGYLEAQHSLKAWNELLAVIESRLPSATIRDSVGSTPLVAENVAKKWTDQSFQLFFLTKARSPVISNLKIAPGVTVWTSESFEATHVRSGRRKAIGTGMINNEFHDPRGFLDVAPTLVFPSDTIVPKSAASPLDNLWDRESASLERRAGLYLSPSESWSDAVTFIDGKGNNELFTYENGWCPWMPDRPLATLREVLALWKCLIEDGVWTVNEEGVVGGMEYFDDPIGMAKAVDAEHSQTGVMFRAKWDAAPAY